MKKFKKLVVYYPLIAGFSFWIGAIEQIRMIIELKSAYSVSGFQWGLSAIILAGYCGFYALYMKPGRARLLGIIVSAISSLLYLIILFLTLYY